MRVMTLGEKVGQWKTHCIGGELADLQKEVGGYIEPAAPLDIKKRNIEMLVDAEGAFKGLPINPNLFPYVFYGRALFVGVKGEEFVSLTLPQIKFLHAWLGTGVLDGDKL